MEQRVIKDLENLNCKGRVSVLTFVSLKERCEKQDGEKNFKIFKKLLKKKDIICSLWPWCITEYKGEQG